LRRQICVISSAQSRQSREFAVSQISNHSTGDAAFAVDRSYQVVLWNPAAQEAFGYPNSEALGQQCWKLLCSEDAHGNQYRCEHCPLRDMAFHQEPLDRFHTTFKTASGESRHFEVACLTVCDEPGHKLLFHICHPEKQIPERDAQQSTDVNLPDSHIGTLSKREIEVLSLLADGNSTREIAEIMGITAPTVRNHIQHMLYKLHVHNRLEAVMLGKRLDLI